MHPIVGVLVTTLLGFLQLGVACAISGVVAQLDGSFSLTHLNVFVPCALSMDGTDDMCTYSYVSTAIGILLSLVLVGTVCASVEGSRGMGFCGPIISFVGFLYFAIYAGIVTVSARDADKLSDEGHGLRQAVVGLAWSAVGLYTLTFFLSAATAKSNNLRGDGAHSTLQRTLTRNKYYKQPAPSPASSPKKAWIPMEQGSPKKWRQPHNPRSQFVVTSNGVRTLLVVAGTPTTLSRTTTLSAGGSAPGSVAGSMPNSPTKMGPHSPMVVPAHALPQAFFQPHPYPHPHPAHGHMQHSHSSPGMSVPPLPRSTSNAVPPQGAAPTHPVGAHPHMTPAGYPAHPPLRSTVSLPQQSLLRGHSASSHRLAHGSDASSSGNTPRDPTARV